jgi:hypothetical protein
VDAVEDGGGAVELGFEQVRPRDVDGAPLDQRMFGAGARAGQLADRVALRRQLFGDGPADGSCSGDDL